MSFTFELKQNMKNECFSIQKFMYDPEFLSSSVFYRYVDKCKRAMTDFLVEWVCPKKNYSYSEKEFRDLFLASYFHLLREGETQNFLGELSLETVYGRMQASGAYYEEIFSWVKELVEATQVLTLDYPEPIAEEMRGLLFDMSMGEIVAMHYFEDCGYDIFHLLNHSIASSCRIYLEQECMSRNLVQTQINLNAVPSTFTENHQLYNQTLLIFHTNLMLHILEVNQDERIKEKTKKAKQKHKDKVKELTSTNQLLQKELSVLQTESKKKTSEELQRLVSKDNDELIISLQNEIKDLKRKLTKADKEIESLASKNEFLEAQVYTTNEMIEDLETQEFECDFTKKYAFVCQHETLKAKIKQAFPNSMIIDKPIKTALSKLKVEMVIMITAEMSHSLYGTIKQNAISSNVPYLHCKEVNIDKIATCIAYAMNREN